MKKLLLLLACALISGTSSAASGSADSDQKFAEAMSSFIRSETVVRSAAEEYGFTGSRVEIMRRYFQSLADHPEIWRYVIRQYRQIGLFDRWEEKRDLTEETKKVSLSLLLALGRDGIRRLGPEDQKAFLRFTGKSYRMENPRICRKLALSGDPADFRGTELRDYMREVFAGMPDAEVSRHFDIVSRSVVAAVNDNPAPRSLSASEEKYGTKAWQRKMLEKLLRLPPAEVEKLAAALANIESAPDAETCRAARLMVESALEVEGTAGDWARAGLLNALAR
ncbi:MAG: hypothetical protein MR009_09445 [Sutterellaceae bacterium]|nr:hypothetical protein [Sutterellaceae bacterium]MDD7441176.1 hypothetical protein [Sutterellaceae bacterium]MDY2868350.1 hypothetical protein [Mesosutterella sp.]